MNNLWSGPRFFLDHYWDWPIIFAYFSQKCAFLKFSVQKKIRGLAGLAHSPPVRYSPKITQSVLPRPMEPFFRSAIFFAVWLFGDPGKTKPRRTKDIPSVANRLTQMIFWFFFWFLFASFGACLSAQNIANCLWKMDWDASSQLEIIKPHTTNFCQPSNLTSGYVSACDLWSVDVVLWTRFPSVLADDWLGGNWKWCIWYFNFTII